MTPPSYLEWISQVIFLWTTLLRQSVIYLKFLIYVGKLPLARAGPLCTLTDNMWAYLFCHPSGSSENYHLKTTPPIVLIGKNSVCLLLWFLCLWLLGMLIISSCLCTCSLFCDMTVRAIIKLFIILYIAIICSVVIKYTIYSMLNKCTIYWKDFDAGKYWRQKKKVAEDEVVR